MMDAAGTKLLLTVWRMRAVLPISREGSALLAEVRRRVRAIRKSRLRLVKGST